MRRDRTGEPIEEEDTLPIEKLGPHRCWDGRLDDDPDTTWCRSAHRTPRTLAACLWPRAAWVIGEGEHALLSRCRVLTVNLYGTRVQRDAALAALAATGCGWSCTGDHEPLRMDLAAHRAVTS